MESKSKSKRVNLTSARYKDNGVLFVVISTVIIALGQIAFKLGTLTLDLSLKGTILNFWLIIGLVLYAIATVLLLVGLKLGELSTLYPIIGLAYIWVCILSFFIFRETITLLNGFGILLIVLGVGLLGGVKHG